MVTEALCLSSSPAAVAPLSRLDSAWKPSESITGRGSGEAATADAGASLGCLESHRMAGAGRTLPAPYPRCVMEGTAGPRGTPLLLLLGLG